MTGRHRVLVVETDQPGLGVSERKAVVHSTVFRVLGTPVVAVAGLISAALMIRATGPTTYGLVALVATVGLLFPFADLGIGAVVTSAASKTHDPRSDPDALAVIRRAYRILSIVTVAVVILALIVMAFDGWGTLLGSRTGPEDRIAVTAAVIIFALTIPAGLGLRILIGVDRAQLVVLVMVSNTLFGLALTAAMYFSGIRGIWFVLPPLGGALLGNLLGTVVALRTSGIGLLVFRRATGPLVTRKGVLEGSLWLFLVSVGIPFGLQAQRVVLSHLSSPEQLSQYALMAQLYGLVWSVFSTAALAFWPIFVKRRADADQTVKLWLQTTGVFGLLAACAAVPLVALSPWLSGILSKGSITVTASLAGAFALLLFTQCLHLPSGVLLTSPVEARWQAMCLGAMALFTVVAAIAVAPSHGAVGVVFVTAIAVAVCQLIPDFTRVPTLVRRRQPEAELISL